MPNALITGSPSRASNVADALRSGGFEPLCAGNGTSLADACASVPPKSLDCYIQLPDDRHSSMTAVAQATAMVADRARTRYEAVATVTPLLAETATVVLVMGDRAGDEGRPDLFRAADDLTHVLAGTMRDIYRATAVRVEVVENHQSPAEIASIVRRGEGPAPAMASYVDFQPGLGFAEWRLDVLSLMTARP